MGLVRVKGRDAEETEQETEQTKDTTQDDGKNPHAVALGRLGGLKGGKVRANKLTREQRHEIAVKAAKARWQNSNNIS